MSSDDRLSAVQDYHLSRHDRPGAERPAAGPDFSRMTSFAPASLLAPEPALEPAQAEPETPGAGAVSAKSFIGPNATYYDERWRWMHWRGRTRSWNWAAAFTFGGWLAYRRMHRWALLHGVWLALLIALAFVGAPTTLLVLAETIVALGLGIFGNTLYFRHYMRRAEEIGQEHLEHEALSAAATRAGGVDTVAAWRYASGVIGLVLLVILLAGLPGAISFQS